MSLGIIQEKARSLHEKLKKQHGESSTHEPFNSSRGWFMRFKARANLHNIRVSGKAASADEEAARAFPDTLAKIIEEGGYCACQVSTLMLTKLGSFGGEKKNATKNLHRQRGEIHDRVQSC